MKRCINCQAVKRIHGGGRCNACYQYHRKHGRDSTPEDRHRAQRAKVCQHCGAQEIEAQGLCAACFVYRERHDKPRPRHLFDTPPTCDCGQPAVTLAWLRTARAMEPYHLCAACVKLEEEVA